MKKNKTSMLEYCKIILQRVQFDRTLWRKEYRKSLLRLSPDETSDLKNWVRNQIGVPASQPLNSASHG